jgi:penicillin V acylase-like amidase (Ntn superfamily)
VRAAYYANGLLKPVNPGEGAANMFRVIRNVSVPFGSPVPEKPNVARTIFRTVQDLKGGRYDFESTHAPNVVWPDMTKLDFSKWQPEKELQVEKKIFSLNSDVTNQIEEVKPFVFGKKQK